MAEELSDVVLITRRVEQVAPKGIEHRPTVPMYSDYPAGAIGIGDIIQEELIASDSAKLLSS